MKIYILPSILSSKNNYTTKSAQLIEYNIKNIFPEKSGTNFDRGTSHRLFFK